MKSGDEEWWGRGLEDGRQVTVGTESEQPHI